MRIAVLGVGLIGGSIGLAARRAGHVVVGFDAGGVETALSLGALDAGAGSIGEALDGAQAAFVAVPVGSVSDVVLAALAVAAKDTLLSDAASCKRAVVSAAGGDERFCGGHPLAGAESSGVQHARADLFDGAVWYLTPVAGTSGVLYDRLFRLVRELGARPAAIDPDVHDRVLASVSHLPHVLANVLVSEAAGVLGSEQVPAVGPSFRDATRVAGAPGAIWDDIYMANADALVSVLDGAVTRLGAVRDALRRGDREWVSTWNGAAAGDRARLLAAGDGGAVELVELRASVPNRPGVVAEIALALGRGGVNIVDMALHPAADMSEGVVAVWVAGAEVAARAQALLAEQEIPVVIL